MPRLLDTNETPIARSVALMAAGRRSHELYFGDYDRYNEEPVDDYGYSNAERAAFVKGAEFEYDRQERLQGTAWVRVALRFRDRNTGVVREEREVLMEVVMDAPDQVVFQDVESGCHRLVHINNIEGVQLDVKP